MNTFILMSDRVSKELSASTKSLSESRECFIEVYINNRCGGATSNALMSNVFMSNVAYVALY